MKKTKFCLSKLPKNEENYEINFNFPLLLLLLILLSVSGKIVWVLWKQSGLLFLMVIGLVEFFLSLFIVGSCCYYFFKILNGKCRYCARELENSPRRRAFSFLLAPPWKKRKVKFICLDCKKSLNAASTSIE